jgi:hypothetical protein
LTDGLHKTGVWLNLKLSIAAGRFKEHLSPGARFAGTREPWIFSCRG